MKMAKHLVFMCLIFNLVSCGQKSVVKTDVKPQTFAETSSSTAPTDLSHKKDGLLRRSFPLPITTDPVASPVPDFGFFFGGIAKFIANLGAKLGAGKTEMYFHQPTPELPDVVKEVRLKRVFFYIEPKANASRRTHWFNRFFRGKGDVDFNFMKKLVLRVKPEVADMRNVCLVPDQGKFQPQFPCKDPELTSSDTEKYLSAFNEIAPTEEPDLGQLEEFVILKYNGNEKQKHMMNDQRGSMYMFRTKRPGETYHFINTKSGYNGLIENMVSLDNVILVELKKDAVKKEQFEAQLARDAEFIDSTLQVEQIEECNPSICLDVKVEEANLLPFLKRLNSNRIEAFIDARKVPETFQLKGFIEFELGFDIGF
jgi:hypothetical protein